MGGGGGGKEGSDDGRWKARHRRRGRRENFVKTHVKSATVTCKKLIEMRYQMEALGHEQEVADLLGQASDIGVPR